MHNKHKSKKSSNEKVRTCVLAPGTSFPTMVLVVTMRSMKPSFAFLLTVGWFAHISRGSQTEILPSSENQEIKGSKLAFVADFSILTLAKADAIANAAIEEAVNRNFPPITVVVVDPAGRVIVQKRMDHCANGPAAFAQAKVFE